MRLGALTLIAAAVAIGGLQQASPSTNVSGRWRLVDPTTASPAVASEFLVTLTESNWLTIERRFPSSVSVSRYPVSGRGISSAMTSPSAAGTRAPRPAPVEAVWTGAAFLIRTGTAGAAPRATDHEELWSIEGDRLHVDNADRVFGGPARTSRITYQRVPLPNSVDADQNLLENGNATESGAYWLITSDAAVEPCDGDPCFRLRKPGGVQQTVLLPASAVGKYLVAVGSAASERVNSDGVITGLPSLYGLIGISDGTRFVGYLTGQNMLARPPAPGVWAKMSGVFRVPERAARISFQLHQAEARGTPPNGSAVRFDNLGLYLFPSEAEAQSFAAKWQGRGNQ